MIKLKFAPHVRRQVSQLVQARRIYRVATPGSPEWRLAVLKYNKAERRYQKHLAGPSWEE
jgi:hypothetical protein